MSTGERHVTLTRLIRIAALFAIGLGTMTIQARAGVSACMWWTTCTIPMDSVAGR